MCFIIISFLSFVTITGKIMQLLMVLEMLSLINFFYFLSVTPLTTFFVVSFIVLSSLLGFIILLNTVMFYGEDKSIPFQM